MSFTQGLSMAIVSLPWLTQALLLPNPIMAEEFRAGHDNIHPRQELIVSSSTTTSVTATEWVTVYHSTTALPSHISTLTPTSTFGDLSATAPTQATPSPSSTSKGGPLSFTRPWDSNNVATTASPVFSGPLTPSISSTSTSTSTSISWSFSRAWGSSSSSSSSSSKATTTESTSRPGPGPLAPSITSTRTEELTLTPSITSTRTEEVTLTPPPSLTTSLPQTTSPGLPSPTPWNPRIPDLLHEPQLSAEAVCGRFYTKDYSYWIVQLPPQWWKRRYRESATDACFRTQQALWAIWADFVECYEMTRQQASGAPGWLHMRFVSTETDPGDYAVEGIINEIRDPELWRRNPLPNKCRHFPLEEGEQGHDRWEKRSLSLTAGGLGRKSLGRRRSWEETVQQNRDGFAMLDAAAHQSVAATTGDNGLIDATTAVPRPTQHPATS